MNCKLRNDGKKRNKGPNAKSCKSKGGEGCCLEEPFKSNCEWKTNKNIPCDTCASYCDLSSNKCRCTKKAWPKKIM